MEAGHRPAGSTEPAHRVASTGVHRSTETKQAFKTTEFWLTVAVVAGILISALVINGGDTEGSDEFVASQAWLYVAVVTLGYCIGRGAAKAGSRDPYTDR